MSRFQDVVYVMSRVLVGSLIEEFDTQWALTSRYIEGLVFLTTPSSIPFYMTKSDRNAAIPPILKT